MILETWFILVLISTIAGGVGSFLYKVAAKENIDIVLLAFCNSVTASTVLFVAAIVFGGTQGFWHPMLLMAAITAFTYLMTSMTKVRSLENIDSAIFFPLYKVFGPGLVIILGITLFGETFTVYEWIGLVVSLLVPFLLISRAEDGRQINLRAGLWWLFLAVVISAVSAGTWKHGADIAPNTWMYVFACELMVMPAALASLYHKNRGRLREKFAQVTSKRFMTMLAVTTVIGPIAGATFVFALTNGAELGIAYTINSLYILIPIILSIIFYNEHWNARKVAAIILSIVALAFFG